MRSVAALLGISLFALTGCLPLPAALQPRTVIDWVAFVRFNGVTYEAAHGVAEPVLEATDLGPVFAHVQVNVTDTVHGFAANWRPDPARSPAEQLHG